MSAASHKIQNYEKEKQNYQRLGVKLPTNIL